MTATGQSRRFGSSGRTSAITPEAFKPVIRHDGRKVPQPDSRGAANSPLIDHLVGAGEEGFGDG